MGQKRVGIVIPAFNEGSVIREVLDGLPEIMSVGNATYTLIPIVVDDGSRDKTAQNARGRKGVIVISHLLNSGPGAATRTGLHYAREHGFDFCVTADADGQHSSADIRKVLRAVVSGQGDIVIGSRLADTAGMPWYKVMGNKGLNLITRILLGVSSSDSQSGLRAFNRSALEKLDFRENWYAFVLKCCGVRTVPGSR
jgi:glycosyltransferase involved in cell wall biosynthesis